MATKSQEIRTAFGLLIYKGDYEGAQWSITGFPKDEQLARHFESAYDFEDCIKRNVNCSGIEFDSEFVSSLHTPRPKRDWYHSPSRLRSTLQKRKR
jgi:hypothetical protein